MPIRVYIDQGHNPSAPNSGAEGNGYREQDLVYEIGQRLYTLLSRDSAFEARLSRPTPDTYVGTSNSTSLRERVNAANAWPADLFLSLHTNASVSPEASGVEGLVYATGTKAADIAADLVSSVVRTTGQRDRGVKARPGLYVLKRTTMPAVLMELGFISNSADAELMANRPGLFAEGLYRGLKSYYGV